MENDCEVTYLMAQEYNLDCEKGVKYSDQTFKISFPYDVTQISEKDNSWEPFKI
jgi:dTDP-4-dehydrorhamnose 3,5-epimerase-like enzyme